MGAAGGYRGKSTDLGLGGYPLVSLREARDKAQVNRKLARSGSDPRTAQRSVPTFAEVAGKVIEFNRPTWRGTGSAAQWSSTLATYAFPHFGDKPVDEISSGDVMNALTPIWTAKPETARRVRQRVSAVMKWAIANDFRSGNPAGEAIDAALPRTSRFRSHYRALHYTEVPAVIGVIRSSGALPVTKLSLEFLVLTAARSGEVRRAAWEEMDPEARTWVISAGRMKAGREHRVPLQDRALAILEETRPLGCRSGLVFPVASGNPLSNATYGKLLQRSGVDCVPHGFRSSFRDWAAEQTDAPHAVMEAALAHHCFKCCRSGLCPGLTCSTVASAHGCLGGVSGRMKLEFLLVFYRGRADGMAMLPKAGLFLCFGLLLVLAPFQHTAGCSNRHPVCCCQRR